MSRTIIWITPDGSGGEAGLRAFSSDWWLVLLALVCITAARHLRGCMTYAGEDYVSVPACPRCGGYHPEKFEPAWDTDDGEEDYPPGPRPDGRLLWTIRSGITISRENGILTFRER